MKVLFIGQNPSSKNIDPCVPFLGTKSYYTLTAWMQELGLISGVDKIYVVNASGLMFGKVTLKDADIDGLINALKYEPDKIVCLGKYASKVWKKALKQMTINPPIAFELPHPSPRNRHLNNRAYVRRCLKLCKEYLTS